MTRHALWRAAQAGLRSADLTYVQTHGRVLRRTGVNLVWLGNADVPRADRAKDECWRLVGVVIVIDDQGVFITTYHSGQHGLRKLAKKPKYRVERYPQPQRLEGLLTA